MIIGVILLIYGAMEAISGLALLLQRRRRQKKCLPVTGKLVEKTKIRLGMRRYPMFICEYTVDGVDFREPIPSATAKGEFTVGEPIELLYTADEPGRAFLLRTGGEIASFAIGGGIMAIGVVLMIVF